MVIINAEDAGKSEKQVLLELIYEATGQIIPLDKIQFGKPREIDKRKDLPTDPNTFIPVIVDNQFDDRYPPFEDNGIMYRRRDLAEQVAGVDFGRVMPLALPFRTRDILDDINAALGYPLSLADLVEHVYATDEELALGCRLEAHPESLLWVGDCRIQINTSKMDGELLILQTNLPGFYEYGTAPPP